MIWKNLKRCNGLINSIVTTEITDFQRTKKGGRLTAFEPLVRLAQNYYKYMIFNNIQYL